MSFSKKEKIVLAAIMLLLILIPSGSVLIAQRSKISDNSPAGKAPAGPVTSARPDNSTPSKLESDINNTGEDDSDDDYGTSDSSVKTYFGPTLSFKINIEGRPATDQSGKIFVGLTAGDNPASPQFLLSFLIDLPKNGEKKDISLAGLSQGTTYTAYLKGSAQIATASAFTIKPTGNDLGTLTLLTGDVNEDNIVNNSDYDLVKAKLNSKPTSSNWNPIYDFNLDNIVNSRDLSFVTKNLNQSGASGPWYSKSPFQNPTQTSSAVPVEKESIGGPSPEPIQDNLMKPDSDGYWLFIPNH